MSCPYPTYNLLLPSGNVINTKGTVVVLTDNVVRWEDLTQAERLWWNIVIGPDL